jgi:hypothetical protein
MIVRVCVFQWLVAAGFEAAAGALQVLRRSQILPLLGDAN